MVEFKKEKIKIIWLIYNLILLIFCVLIGFSVYLSRKIINNNNKNNIELNKNNILNKKERLINENYSDLYLNSNNTT